VGVDVIVGVSEGNGVLLGNGDSVGEGTFVANNVNPPPLKDRMMMITPITTRAAAKAYRIRGFAFCRFLRYASIVEKTGGFELIS
jgi:hypothetical protein